MNIFEKMSAITTELGVVAKNLNVSAGKGNSYKAVSERDVLDSVKPLEAKYKVYSYPVYRETVESEQLESESSYNGNVTKRTTFYTRLKTTYRFVNIEKPEEFIDTTVFSVGMDSQDKGDGKAMTYADKYALMKAYKISTGDDPDQDGSVDTDYSKRKKVSNDAKAEAAIKKDGDVSYAVCEECGNNIYDWKRKDGYVMPVKEFVLNSMNLYGKALCKDCIKKRTT